MSELISFIVPAYNVGSYISKCVESIISQSASNWELIIIDDGSSDDTYEICEVYANKDARIKLIHQKNSGVAVARNNGLLLSKGKWVAYVDGDDYINEDFVSILNEYTSSDYNMILFSYKSIYSDKVVHHEIIGKERVLNNERVRDLFKDLIDTEQRLPELSTTRTYVWTKLYRRSFLIDNNIEFEKDVFMYDDILFNLKALCKLNECIYIPYELYMYRIHSESVCHSYSEKHIDRYIISTLAIRDFLEKNAICSDFKQLYQKRALVSLCHICRMVLCHRNNSKSYKERKMQFLSLLHEDVFDISLKKEIIKMFSFKKQVCMWLIYYRLFWVLNIFLKVINK